MIISKKALSRRTLLRGIGATHVCNMSLPTFMDDGSILPPGRKE